jgi:tetratricopeptide (TPR) repeat protein
MEAIYQTLFSNESLGNTRNKANAYTGYGSYQINTRKDIGKGLEYFIKAVEANPTEAQYWINLLKLLVKMRDYDAADHWLNKFRMTSPYGATENDFMHFRGAIDEGRARIEQATADSNRATP